MNEIWKPIPGYEGQYSINPDGDIFCHEIGRTLRRYSANNMYGNEAVTLYKNGDPITYSLARLVAIVFVPNPHNFPCFRYKNGNSRNCKARNLEWYQPDTEMRRYR